MFRGDSSEIHKRPKSIKVVRTVWILISSMTCQIDTNCDRKPKLPLKGFVGTFSQSRDVTRLPICQ